VEDGSYFHLEGLLSAVLARMSVRYCASLMPAVVSEQAAAAEL
jgi:hypothetical protein